MTKPKKNRRKQPKDCYEIALLCLGRRDFSCQELFKRLQEKGFEEQEAAETIARLKEERFLDDARYAAMLVRNKAVYAGWGRKRIWMDLKRRLVDEDVINKALSDYEEEVPDTFSDAMDWTEKATEMLQKKFGTYEGRLEPKEYNRRMSFLVRRGYGVDEAKQALEATKIDA